MSGDMALYAFLGALAVIVVSIIVIVRRSNARTRAELNTKISAIVYQHIDALARRRLQLIRKDPYGKEIFDDWIKEINYFVQNQILPKIMPHEYKYYAEKQGALCMTIDAVAADHATKNRTYQNFRDGMSPSEFETFCAEALNAAGWDARITMRSRDQGVDVIAEKDELRLVIQCKLYARPVGNKAVQEVVAARAHEGADYGAVVSNNRFTAAAEQLAGTNNVLLLHYSDLADIDQHLEKLEANRA